tara:strand:+ start:17450 stop:18253 length:804 start_codon:yes stop_codon:yes gene_type:complete
MKKITLLFFISFSINLFAQDSIVNYLDYKGNSVHKKDAFSVETIVKKDSVWQHTSYYRGGKIKFKGQYQNRNLTNPVGRFYRFFRNGILNEVKTYNSSNQLSGKFKSWFGNEKTNSEGIYVDGLKAGIWKYYHYNGILATKQYFSKGKLIKTVFYNEAGEKIEAELVEYQKPLFKGGGMQDFWERIRDIHNRIRFQINGVIVLNFDIDINGNIVNVTTSDKIPSALERALRNYFKEVKGWIPAISMNRRVPHSQSIPLDFRMKFIDR